MDHDTLQFVLVAFNVGVSIVAALGGWFMRSLMERVRELEKGQAQALEKLAELRTEMPTHYVRRDDFHKLADDLFTLLRRIEDKVDRKADRP